MVERRADRSGQALGPYQLTRLLGAGGFGEVYEADHRLLQQKRAVKLLLDRHFHDSNQRERFLREARTLATLEHPNILPVLEVGEVGTVLYLVMPFYRRGTLNDLLKPRSTLLPLAEVERYLTQMCAAVGYAHARYIAHLDLKPENMLLHEDGRLVLSDFGLAHLIKQGRLEAGSSANWGTPYYMAPEQIRGEPEMRSDLYALGVILYQLLTTQRPFTGKTPEAVMMKHLLEPPPPLRAVNLQALATLEPVIQKALAKQPADRYPTAEALLMDFRSVVSGSSPGTPQPSVPNVPLAAPTQYPNRPAPLTPTTISVPLGRVPQTAQPANMAQTTGRGCEIPLNNGDICGVPAIGRCATCGRAFCRSHLARWEQAYDINQCAPCLAKAEAEEARRREEARTPYMYFESGEARSALRLAGAPTVEIYEIGQEWKNGIFGLGGRSVIVGRLVGYAWLLGTFKWRYHEGPYGGTEVVKDGLTALLDKDEQGNVGGWGSRNGDNAGLVRVERYERGYRSLGGTFGEGSSPHEREESPQWREVAQAVKRLIGKSN